MTLTNVECDAEKKQQYLLWVTRPALPMFVVTSHQSPLNASVKLVESPKKSKLLHLGGQRRADSDRSSVSSGGSSKASSSSISKTSLTASDYAAAARLNSLPDSSDFTHITLSSATSSASSVPLGEGRHGDSLDTLVSDESSSAYSSCIVVDGCEYVVEKGTGGGGGAAHVLERRHVTDSDLRDFCVVEHASSSGGGSGGKSASKKHKPPSDCSSSSGIGRTDTQSDTSSSYTSGCHPDTAATTPTKSVLVKKRKAFKQRKNVTFSDKVALVSTAAELQEPQPEPDYIAYVQALLKRSPGKRTCGNDAPAAPAAPSTPLPARRSATPVNTISGGSKSGYDSDFDEETDDSCASDDIASGDRVQCNLCRKKLIEVTQMFCSDCSYYMSQFAPTVS